MGIRVVESNMVGSGLRSSRVLENENVEIGVRVERVESL